MKKKLIAMMLSAAVVVGLGTAAGTDVFAEETADAAAQTADAGAAVAADGSEIVESGNLLDYLGKSGLMVKEVFQIDDYNQTPDGGYQLWFGNAVVFQMNAEGRIDYINMYQQSPFSAQGVSVGMTRDEVKQIFSSHGWTDKVLTTQIGDLWTFFSPDGYSATVIMDANDVVQNIALSRWKD